MNDLVIAYLVTILFAVSIGIIIFQAIERHLFASQVKEEKNKLLDELSKMAKAVISKNANDYVMTTSIDKVPSEEKPVNVSEDIEMDSLNDDEFDKALGIKRTPPKK